MSDGPSQTPESPLPESAAQPRESHEGKLFHAARWRPERPRTGSPDTAASLDTVLPFLSVVQVDTPDGGKTPVWDILQRAKSDDEVREQLPFLSKLSVTTDEGDVSVWDLLKKADQDSQEGSGPTGDSDANKE